MLNLPSFVGKLPTAIVAASVVSPAKPPSLNVSNGVSLTNLDSI